MTTPEELNTILERIVKHEETETDLKLLRQWLSGGEIVSQQGKYAVNLGQGQEIHIGDRSYYGTDAETIQQIVRSIVQELQQSTFIEPVSLASELIYTLNNTKFQGEEGEQGGTGSFYKYEIYLEAVSLENVQNRDNNYEYKLSGNWSSFVYKYVYFFNKLVDTPWGHNKKPYGRFQVVVKTINGVVDQIQVKADRYNDSANNYAANKAEQLIESKIR